MMASQRGDVALLKADDGLPRGVHGAADPRFANVIRIFAGLFPGRRFGGGTLCVYIEGKPVVDVWTGWSDRAGEVPWTADTGDSPVAERSGWPRRRSTTCAALRRITH